MKNEAPSLLRRPYSSAFSIKSDTEPGSEQWLEINTKYSEIWPNINEKKNPPADEKKYRNEQNKFEKYFKENL